MARNNLAEHVFGHKRRAAHIVNAELHVGALVVGIVQARDDVGHAEQVVGHLGAHEVRIVKLGHRGQHVAILDAGAQQHVLIEADALNGAPVEVASQVGERLGVLVDHADVAAIVREHVRQLRAHTPASYDNDVAHDRVSSCI